VAVLIDLDAVPPPPRAQPKPSVIKPAIGLVALLLLLLMGGAAPPPGDRARLATDTGIRGVTAYLLGTDALYTVDATGVEAEPLSKGGPRWRTRLAILQPELTLTGDTLVVWNRRQSGVTVLDARTGHERWRIDVPGVAEVFGDRVVYWQVDDQLRMADLADGHVRWQRTSEALPIRVDTAHGYVLGSDAGGGATVYSVDDGSVLSEGRQLGVDPLESGLGVGSAEFVGDTLYMHAQTFVAAYRMPDLALRWRDRIVSPEYLGACGALICVSGDHGATALDPVTGRVRWTSPRWRSITADGLAVGLDSRVARIDPATGQVRDELGRGVIAGDLMLRYDGERTIVTTLAGGRVLGVLPVIAPSDCSTSGDRLACVTGSPAVTTWRFTRS
jgi:hypothetical protein